MLFDLRSALLGIFCSIIVQYSIGNYYWVAIKHLIPRQVDLFLAGLLAVYGIQIYYYSMKQSLVINNADIL